ncbi:MAG: hypothetical protein WC566_07220 [Dehalococcoidia bacterium]
MLAQVLLTPAESKKLIAKAIAGMDEVKKAVSGGLIVLHPSSSNYFVVEEILGFKPPTEAWVCGVASPRGMCFEVGVFLASQKFAGAVTSDPGTFPHSWVIREGKFSAGEALSALLEQMGPGDFYIKGVNAVDPQGNVGVLVGNLVEGGTIGRVMSAQRKNSFQIIWPVGMEKLIPVSIQQAVQAVKKSSIDYSMGVAAGLFPCTGGKKIDEMEAINILSGAEAIPISAGGLGGAEGAITLMIKGEESSVKKAIGYVEQSKGAVSPQVRLSNCGQCIANGITCKSMDKKPWVVF